MDLFHSRTQHAVGQGGFHSASIDDGSTVFRYAYDCGSNNMNRLITCIGELREETDSLDVLFLSHLDQDHANGTDKLLDLVQVDTVVLPYLTTFERLVLVTEFLAAPTSGTSATSVLGMLSRPADWFSERGVNGIVFITAAGEGAEAPQIAPPDAPPADGPLTIDISASSDLPRDKASSAGTGGVTKTLTSQPLAVKRSGQPLWVLAPFVQPEGLREDAFRAAVAKLLKFRKLPGDDDRKWLDALKDAIKDRFTRKELADAYRTHIRKDRNLSSMCLYSGPVAPGGAKVWGSDARRLWRHYRNLHHRDFYSGELDELPIGWMGSGDAHLDRKNRRSAFDRFYASYLTQVDTFMLPHHGSRHNLKTDFLHKHSGWTWVAAYGTDNTYGHPDKHLMGAADNYGVAVRVTERRATSLLQTFSLRW